MNKVKKQYVQPIIKEHILRPKQIICQSSNDNAPAKLWEGESYDI